MTAAVASIVGPASFRALRQNGRRFTSGDVRLIYRADENLPRVAFALGRAFASAVERNRARRRLREAFRQMDCVMPTGDYLFVSPPSVLKLTFSELQTRLGLIGQQIAALETSSAPTTGPRQR